jgi:hypothetical protein
MEHIGQHPQSCRECNIWRSRDSLGSKAFSYQSREEFEREFEFGGALKFVAWGDVTELKLWEKRNDPPKA